MDTNKFNYCPSWLPMVLLLLLTIPIRTTTQPADLETMSPSLEDVPYPNPMSHMSFTVSGQDVRMACMDVSPVGAANG